MGILTSVFEIALLIMLPLILFYQRSSWKSKSYILLIPVLYLIWYMSYGFMHELSHMLGVWISGKEIYSFKFFPRFWKGDFGSGYVNYDFQGDKADFFIIALPYLRDIVLLFLGYYLVRKIHIKNPFLVGLILIMFIFSPLYDIINNYSAYLLGSMNDFNALKVSSSAFLSNFIGISFTLIASILCVILITKSKVYPHIPIQ